MVEEETQDVENTLRMVPPDLPLHEDRYAVKKRLQKLRLNTESMILLEEVGYFGFCLIWLTRFVSLWLTQYQLLMKSSWKLLPKP